jgi:O-antigen ligase
MVKEYLPRVKKFLWALFLISLPVTNFRYFPAGLAGSGVNVRPLLIYPLFFLFFLATLPALWKQKLPRVWIPFFVFLIITIVSMSLPVIQGFNSELGEISLQSRLIRSLVTLSLGAVIYLTVSLMANSEEDLRFTLKWLYIGMAIAILWGTLQIGFVLELHPRWYFRMAHIQKYITMNVGTPDRAMGLTLEPSWFADQITSLWLPWVLPAALMDRSVFNKRWGWFTFEKIFLALMLWVLVFTLSRAGFVVALVVIGAGVLFLRPKWIRAESYDKRFQWIGKLLRRFDTLPGIVRIIIVSTGILLALALVFFVASLQSNYIFRMWDYWLGISYEARKIGSRSLAGYFRFIGFGPRFIYWETAYRIFAQNPLLGVGLGNYTFHFNDMLPTVQVGYMPELLTRIVPDYSRVVTAKNYFARLLAETGLLGTAAYLTFLISLAGGGLYLWLSKYPEEKFWGTGALLGLIAFVVDSFSYDSLAIPNPWIVFGLITAALSVYSKSIRQSKENLP